MDDSLAMASDILFELTGRQFPGSCQETVRPCARRADSGGGSPGGAVAGDPYGYAHGGCGCQRSRECGCGGLSAISLGGYPVTQIDEVKVDGDVLAEDLYRVDDYRWLVRLPDADGTRPGWPCCQDLALASTEEGTFEVTFTYGTPPPPAGVRAAAVLGCELALACEPEQASKCRIPRRVQSIVRQGVSMELLIPEFEFLKNGRTGLWEVDLFIFAANPAGLRRPMAVVSPDIPSRVTRAGT
jgi:hypothetical protein